MSPHAAGEPPVRVRVTSPRTSARRQRPAEVGRQIDAQTGLGEAYMASLLRAQLRLAVVVLAVVVAPLALVPVVLVAAPSVGAAELGGVPLAWLVLGVGVYPVVLAAGWWYARRAERVEQAFAELVDRT